MKKEKCELVEKLGVHFEKKEGLAPVAARVFSYIVLNGKGGTTFEELIENLCASKSTISTHLTHLQGLNKIKYYTKTGDRKKYYIMNYDSMVQGINKTIDDWNEEMKIHQEVMAYKLTVNQLKETPNEEKFNIEFHVDFIEFLNKTIASVKEIKNRIIKNHQENN
ncbi:transcriptional regulator [Wenyingzhuangia sp. chi5]|uniref:Transcriptional regulator n=1 Tax=Wenyingzhuangia gilva TaxID=3057677 RepID=A0ABT8VUR7_9FLAO|nr:transcriptional regulator [Wenyingzhuangia sp. chi5]MDO3695721.1 transcriptional regulator [Wenyingzhuangia sp. chi5]